MDSKQRQLMKKYVDLVAYRWRLISISTLLGLSLGLGYYLSLPKLYQSTTLLSYEAQQINPAKMDPEQGKIRLQDSLATLSELVTSRNSLEKVILQFSLYEEARKKVPIEDVIEMMRRNINISPSKKGDVFSVSFEGSSPQQVLRVTNQLASLFIEENLKYREERATETSKYTESELGMSKKVLDEKEQQMRDYKLKYFNEMPDQRQSNFAQLQALLQQRQGLQNSIQELERTKVMAQEQSSMHQRIASFSGQNNSGPLPETDADRLQNLKSRLAEISSKYTEGHPEVRRTKQMVAQLEAKIASGQGGRAASTAGGASRAALAASLESERLQTQIKQIDINNMQLREQLAALPEQIAKYQRWIEAAPVREAEWNALTRDYNELRRHYDQLVAQNLQAQSAENIEKNQKGSRFKIVDSARLPEKPFKPNFLKVLGVALALGLGLSFMTVIAIDFVDTSFKDALDLEDFVGVPVICAVPLIEKESEVRRQNIYFRLSVTGVTLFAIGVMTVIGIMWVKGLIII